jgi:hypothetical protein
MKTHTPEPWGVRVTSVGTNIFSEKQSAYLMYMSQTRTVKEGNANAYRVIECVNAMEGIQNPAEFIASIYDVLKECKHQLQLQEPFRLEDTIAKIDKILKQ